MLAPSAIYGNLDLMCGLIVGRPSAVSYFGARPKPEGAVMRHGAYFVVHAIGRCGLTLQTGR